MGKDYRVIGNIAPNEHVKIDAPLLFGRPQMGLDIPSSKLLNTGYASALGATFGRSNSTSFAPQSYHSPFDMGRRIAGRVHFELARFPRRPPGGTS